MTTTPDVFVRRCQVCGHEVILPWSSDVHRASAAALRSHVEHHSMSDLVRFALRLHFGVMAE